jgi:hypothetical protein
MVEQNMQVIQDRIIFVIRILCGKLYVLLG